MGRFSSRTNLLEDCLIDRKVVRSVGLARPHTGTGNLGQNAEKLDPQIRVQHLLRPFRRH